MTTKRNYHKGGSGLESTIDYLTIGFILIAIGIVAGIYFESQTWSEPLKEICQVESVRRDKIVDSNCRVTGN